MSEVSKQRLAIDLDEIERHLKQAAPRDPLSELAKIVGQDDPFRALLADPASGRRSPTDSSAEGGPAYRGGFETAAPATLGRGFDAEPELHDHGFPDDPEVYDDESVPFTPEPRRSRKGLVAVGAVLGVAVIGVAGAMAFRGAPGSAGGEPPVIQADRNPSKVLPPNPGGVEIPNQDRQILERGQDRQTKVVSREEQPVDVRQATRGVVASAGGVDLIPAGLGVSGTTGAMGPQTAAAAIGIEPKKVRTVSVRPDGTVGPADASGAARTVPVAAPGAMTISALAAGGPAITSSTTAATRTRPGSTATPGASEAPRATTGAADSATTGGGAQAAVRPQRVASATPVAMAALAEPAEKPAGAGAFTVQLTTSGSEAEGRTAFKALQQKFAGELGSRAPVIRKHEADGKTVYRVRVGPMSKDDANSLCSRLKSSGGACFVAGT